MNLDDKPTKREAALSDAEMDLGRGDLNAAEIVLSILQNADADTTAEFVKMVTEVIRLHWKDQKVHVFMAARELRMFLAKEMISGK